MDNLPSFDGAMLERRLQDLSACSAHPWGLWRAAYTQEDAAAKEILSRWFTEEGFTSTRTDCVGNQYGLLQGTSKKPGTILIGSHLDTVKNAGIYDGTVGILLGICAAGALAKHFGPPKRNVEVGAFVEEEGSRFPAASYLGSRAINGSFSAQELELTDDQGVSLAQAAAAAGYPIERFPSAVRNDLICYIEPHIEQGCVLDRTQTQIGLVEAITGFTLLTATVSGRADHAGTTPMTMRHDALLAASGMISRMPDLLSSQQSSDTITVGSISAQPGSSNVVPDCVEFTVDVRSTSAERLDHLCRAVDELCRQQAGLHGCSVQLTRNLYIPPVSLDARLIDQLEDCCHALDLTCRRMPSGAGHDCMHFAPRTPSAMFFLPSKDGRSHCPQEYTSPEQLSYGAGLLAKLLYQLAWG